VQARNFTAANRTKIDVIVIHDMEYPERSGGAMWCANFFAGPGAPQASAHFAVDNQTIVQCVKEKDVAWHAPGANHNGIGIEHAGYAAQSRDQWLDDYSTAELKLSAQLVATLCARWGIPIVKLSMDDLKAGARGICGHLDITMAFNNGKGHTDPGPSFPWPEYIQWVKDAAGA
jgi:N-acetyl-anhydromuramyl-L-alanine amidase AmpD